MMSIKLKKMFALFLGLLISVNITHAQTWSEWFSQKKTQKKYLLEQTAVLKVYAGYVKKGYEIGSSGLDFIKGATKGEFDLHGTFFSSLKAVSPAIRNNTKIAEVVQMQFRISKALTSVKRLGSLSPSNLAYIDLVEHNLLSGCLQDIEELLLIITSGKIAMSDDERLGRIDKLYHSMQEKQTFALSFCQATRTLSGSRAEELKTLKEMEEWYEN